TATFTVGSPFVSSFFPVSFVAGRATTVNVGGTGFDQSMTPVITNGNGTATTTTVTGTTGATLTDTPTTVGTQGLYLYTDNGGYTSTGTLTVSAAPTVT